MSSMMLLFGIGLVWLLWAFAVLIGKAVQDDLRGIPPEKRTGVSLAPILPFFPLAFWGVAVLIDLFAAPWGTWIVGGFHLLLGAVYLGCIVASLVRLRSTPPAA